MQHNIEFYIDSDIVKIFKSYVVTDILSTSRTCYCRSTVSNNVLIRCEMRIDD